MTTAATTNPDYVVFRIALADLPPDTIDRWWANTSDPTVVRKLIRAGINPKRYDDYLHSGVDSPTEIARLHNKSIAPPTVHGYRQCGVTDPLDMRRLWHRNCRPDDLITLTNAGLTLDDIHDLVADGHSGRRLVAYTTVGLTDPATIRRLVAARVMAFDVEAFRASGVEDLDRMVAITAAGVPGVDYQRFLTADITEIDHMVRLLTHEVSSLDANGYRQLGVDTVDAMVDSATRGMTPTVLGAYRTVPVATSNAEALHAAGVSPTDAHAYQRTWPDDPPQWIEFHRHGLDPRTVAVFRVRCGVDDPPTMIRLSERLTADLVAGHVERRGPGAIDDLLASL